MSQTFDFIVVGGGSAGAIVAAMDKGSPQYSADKFLCYSLGINLVSLWDSPAHGASARACAAG